MTRSSRAPSVPSHEKLRVWVRHGGRCVICNRYLLESDLTLRPVLLGEIAHNRAASDRGPRADPALSDAGRNRAENLLLLCGAHHPDVDKPSQLDLFTFEQLAELKARHEEKIRLATERVGGERTAILRVLGNIKGAPVDIGPNTAAQAVIRSANRFPEMKLSFDRQGVEIDLRQLPEELAGSAAYYQAGQRRIDELIESRLRPAIEKGEIEHLSVLAMARLPLLVYLGSRLDDTVPTDVYQRHRAGETWAWTLDADDDIKFRYAATTPEEADGLQEMEAVLIVNVSGTIHSAELPPTLGGLTVYVIEPTGETPHPDTVRSRQVRDAFEKAFRDLLADIEAHRKSVKRLHLFAAAPVSIAVTIGRSVSWQIQPTLLVYDRQPDGTYIPVLEVTHR